MVTMSGAIGAAGIAASSADASDLRPAASVTSTADVLGEIHDLKRDEALDHLQALAHEREVAAARKAAAARAEAARKAAAERASREAHRRALFSGDPRTIGHAMLVDFGWSDRQWECLDSLWTRESGWRIHETNPGSGAYGIPQALPGYKMAWAGSDWRDNPRTQISWGLHYIAQRYGTPCGAWAHSQSYNFY